MHNGVNPPIIVLHNGTLNQTVCCVFVSMPFLLFLILLSLNSCGPQNQPRLKCGRCTYETSHIYEGLRSGIKVFLSILFEGFSPAPQGWDQSEPINTHRLRSRRIPEMAAL